MAMLRPVRIARPVDQHEGLVASFEHRQYDLSRDVSEIFLLLDVRDRGPGGLEIADPLILAARWCCERQPCGSQCRPDFFGQRNAGRAASGVIEKDCSFTGLLSVIEEGGCLAFTDGRSAEPACASSLEHSLFVKIVATEMLIEFAPNPTIVDGGRHASVGAFDWTPHIEGVAVVAGVAQMVAGRHRRRIGGGESREQRMRILEIDPLVPYSGHGRRAVQRDAQGPQPVRHK